MSDFIPHFTGHIITYPCLDQISSMLVKGATGLNELTHLSHFADDIFRWIFVNEKFCILIEIPLKFVPKGPIDNKPALV